MKKHDMWLLLIELMMVFVAISTGINIVLLGTTETTFFTGSNLLIVALFWLWQGFNVPVALVLGIVLYLLFVLGLLKTLCKKAIQMSAVLVCALDMLLVLFLIFNARWLGCAGAFAIEMCIVLFYLNRKYEKHKQDKTGDGTKPL